MNDSSTQPFLMSLLDAYSFKDRGIIVHGVVQHGVAKIYEKIEILGLDQPTARTTISGIVHIHFATIDASIAYIKSGQADLLLRGVTMQDCAPCRMIAHPGSIQAHTRFKCDVHFLETEEGGRTQPIYLVAGYVNLRGYRPQFFVYGMDFACFIEHPAPETIDYRELIPGEQAEVVIQLITSVAIDVGIHFSIREGAKVVATGQVTEILSD